eukprot:m.96622 g.96622  ORF g.96622 m.96622 type:complete len:787 (-) comp26910_c0_seq4:447-2807(-)
MGLSSKRRLKTSSLTRARSDISKNLSFAHQKVQHLAAILSGDGDLYDEQETHQAFDLMVIAGVTSATLSFILFAISELIANKFKPVVLFVGVLTMAVSFLTTYFYAGKVQHKNKWMSRRPFQGGIRFVALEATSWTLFLFSMVLPLIPVIVAYLYPQVILSGFAITGGAVAVLCQMTMVSSLAIFQSEQKPTEASSPLRRMSFIVTDKLMNDRLRNIAHEKSWWGWFVSLQVLVSVVACILSIVSDIFAGTLTATWLLGGVSFFCTTLSLMLTHGFGGLMLHSRNQWHFFQPLVGGKTFVGRQAFGWTLFGFSVYFLGMRLDVFPGRQFYSMVYYQLCAVSRVFTTETKQEESLDMNLAPPFSLSAILATAAQIIVATSLAQFESPTAKPTTTVLATSKVNATKEAFRVLLVLTAYNMEKVLGACLLISMAFAPIFPTTTTAIWVLFFLRYIPTYWGAPGQTGARVIDRPGSRLFDEISQYFEFEVVKRHTLNPKHKHIFGFHPHGIIPMTIAWGPFTSKWKKVLPGIKPSLLVASIIHYVPILRDVAQWYRSCEVSRAGFHTALHNHKAIILVPGGQAEMIMSRSQQDKVSVYAAHKGFIAVALKEAQETETPLHVCPIFGFGETEVFDNISVPAKYQDLLVKTFRANVCYCPWGQYYLPGFPRPEKLTVAVGKPVLVPRLTTVATPEHVDLLHSRYMHELQTTFDQFKAESSQAHTEVDFVPEIKLVCEDTFEAKWEKIPLGKETEHKKRKPPGMNKEGVWSMYPCALGVCICVGMSYIEYVCV